MNPALLLLGFIGGLLWLALVRANLRLAVWLVLLWVPIQGWFQLNVFNDSNLTVLTYEFMLLGIYLVFGARYLKSPDRFKPPRVFWIAVPFAVWTLLLIPYSLSETGPVPTLIGLRTFLGTIPLLWLGYYAFEHRRQLENVTAVIVLEFVVIGVITASQFAGLTSLRGSIFELPVGYTAAGYAVRPPGTFSHPGLLGHFVLFGVPVAIGLLGLNAPYVKRVCYGLGLAGITVALLSNTQRAAAVLLALVIPLMLLLARRVRTWAMATVALGVMLVAFTLTSDLVRDAFQRRVESISEDIDRVINSPAENLQDALRTPYVGAGLGIASPGVGRLIVSPTTERVILRPDSAKFGESFVAALLYETGLPGLVLCYVFLIATLYASVRALRACRGTDTELLAAAIVSLQVAILLYSWTYSPLKTPPGRVLYWFWIGVLLRLPEFATARRAASAATAQLAVTAASRLTPRAVRPRLVATHRRVG